MIIDGRAISRDILDSVRTALQTPVVVRVIVVAPTEVTNSYLRIKQKAALQAGMTLELVELPLGAGEKDVKEAIVAPGADSIVLQLPLPSSLNEASLRSVIPVEQDADVLSPLARTSSRVLPPVADAVKEVLMRAGISIVGKKVVVVGEGFLVGAPVASWLTQSGAHVHTLNSTTLETEEGRVLLLQADIIVSGAGVPRLITPEMIADGVVLIDAGTSSDSGSIVGDIDPACSEKASVYTPVPGGVGPIAVACLFRNVALLSGSVPLRSFD